MTTGKEGISSYLDWVFRAVRDRRFVDLPIILNASVKKVAPEKTGEVETRIKDIEAGLFGLTGVPFAVFAEVWARSIARPLGSAVYFTQCKRRKKRYTVRELQEIGYEHIAMPYIKLIGFVFEESGIDLEAVFGGGVNEKQGITKTD